MSRRTSCRARRGHQRGGHAEEVVSRLLSIPARHNAFQLPYWPVITRIG